MAASDSFHLLDPRIQKFLWAEGWEALRDAQERAIPLIVANTCDVIVAAATAAGKTEAAFLPALTRLLSDDEARLIVYVSPLKALINDQFGRLDRLCEQLDVPVWPWHGDVSGSIKAKFAKARHGVLLITPESLEATLCNRGSSVRSAFGGALCFIIDELHAFIGSERGKQLQSLLHRIERALERTVPRIGLSATLGDMTLAADFLRPGKGSVVQIVESKGSETALKVLVRGFQDPKVVKHPDDDESLVSSPSTGHIADILFKELRGSNNLVFPNSRGKVEEYTYELDQRCERERVPREFWPHHGSLSKEVREETERALKQKDVPATALCTNTMELGIDIGAVKSVAQIGVPPSVASLRQRLGRSGRRKGEAAILRSFIVEDEISSNSGPLTLLRESTCQMAAMVLLLVEGWFEPPPSAGLHISTLVQQLLSAISQYGSPTIGQLYGLLCGEGAPFQGVSKSDLVELVRALGQKELVIQDSSGGLLHGELGEKMVNHYSFYAAFSSEDEYRVISTGKSIGAIPTNNFLRIGDNLLLGGRTWRVESVDEDVRVIFVSRISGGKTPLFLSGWSAVHTRIRRKMRQLYESNIPIGFLDKHAQAHLDQGRKYYSNANLEHVLALDAGTSAQIWTWLGDPANQALVQILNLKGLRASCAGPLLSVEKGPRSMESILDVFLDLAICEAPCLELLLADVKNIRSQKWDWCLPEGLLRRGFASQNLNIEEAYWWLRNEFKPYVLHRAA